MKTCNGCGETKPREAFSKRGASGLQSRCRACNREHNRDHYEANKKRFAERKRGHQIANRERNLANGRPTEGTKECRSCKQELHVDHFYADSGRSDGLQRSCKPCILNSNARRKSQFRDRVLATNDRCGICGDTLTESDNVHLDHIVPLAVGGEDTEENMQPAHAFCNTGKKDRGLDPSGLFLYSTCHEDL